VFNILIIVYSRLGYNTRHGYIPGLVPSTLREHGRSWPFSPHMKAWIFPVSFLSRVDSNAEASPLPLRIISRAISKSAQTAANSNAAASQSRPIRTSVWLPSTTLHRHGSWRQRSTCASRPTALRRAFPRNRDHSISVTTDMRISHTVQSSSSGEEISHIPRELYFPRATKSATLKPSASVTSYIISVLFYFFYFLLLFKINVCFIVTNTRFFTLSGFRQIYRLRAFAHQAKSHTVTKLNNVVYCIRKSSRHKNKIVHLDKLASVA